MSQDHWPFFTGFLTGIVLGLILILVNPAHAGPQPGYGPQLRGPEGQYITPLQEVPFSETRKLYHECGGPDFDWLPQGKFILFMRYASGNLRPDHFIRAFSRDEPKLKGVAECLVTHQISTRV